MRAMREQLLKRGCERGEIGRRPCLAGWRAAVLDARATASEEGSG